jgi:hypothetical protein
MWDWESATSPACSLKPLEAFYQPQMSSVLAHHYLNHLEEREGRHLSVCPPFTLLFSSSAAQAI